MSNYPPGVTDDDPYFIDESEPDDEVEDYCPMCGEIAFVDGHCCVCDYDSDPAYDRDAAAACYRPL